jgi:hypothetical protein
VLKRAQPKKQKSEAGDSAARSKSAPRLWTDEEELALVQACYDILRVRQRSGSDASKRLMRAIKQANVPTIAAHPALHSRETSKVRRDVRWREREADTALRRWARSSSACA